MSDQQMPGADQFMNFWSDMMSRSGMPGGTDSNENSKQMQRMFFDAWAKACDDYMRSPQFCQMLKQTMDAALSFRKQTNEFLGKVHNQGQNPSLSDIDDLASIVRVLEERVLAKVEELDAKVSEMSVRVGGRPAKPQAKEPSGSRTQAKKTKKTKKTKKAKKKGARR